MKKLIFVLLPFTMLLIVVNNLTTEALLTIVLTCIVTGAVAQSKQERLLLKDKEFQD
jgi:hypothetical protein